MQNRSNALVIGADGTIGQALCNHLKSRYVLHRVSRINCDYSEDSLAALAEQLSSRGRFSIIICTIGVLHNQVVSPEKRMKEIDAETLSHYFFVNTILPALCVKHFSGLLDKKSQSAFACLSAMVGSTSDNQLGGWYGYRTSKAALNSLIKTAAIELKRTHKFSRLVAIHPGTTIGNLSTPFAQRVKPENYYSPELSAKRIVDVIENLNVDQTGCFLNWDGRKLPW